MGYLFLMISIIGELIGTSMLKASESFTKLWPVLGTVAGFGLSFFFLSLSLKTVPLNAAYAIWSGIGTVATVIISVLIWKEKVNIGSVIGIALIIVGVIVLNLFGPGHAEASVQSGQE
ncbi:DMT family transporter [Bacillus massiliglaciei]|uniref:DMT family transporter n=1 Tax=Bacillus massiliglaciei TaxID=1816693 RepID=UPI000ACA3314|nr:multidrug efflux SMR transporter [Bacillus massiliglaciei]